MNSHLVTNEKLIAYAANELGAQELVCVAAHVVFCPECAATVARYGAVRTVVRADNSVTPPCGTLMRACKLFMKNGSQQISHSSRGDGLADGIIQQCLACTQALCLVF